MRSTIAIALALMAAALGTGCNDGSALPEGCDRAVGPESDDDTTAVQLMFEEAQDGETLCFRPGTYSFTDPIELRDLDGVTVRGAGADRDAVVLDFAAQEAGSNGLSATAVTDFTVEHLTILDATGNNLFITGATDVVIRDVRSGWVVRPMEMRGKYALYPVQSTGVLIEESEAFGSSDAGIYVGQVENCIVRDNVAVGNVAGIEIENSTNCEVFGNEAHDNTAGILVFELPGLAREGSGTAVHDNVVRDNNIANFAEAGSIVAIVPAGVGVMVFNANDVEVEGNEIRGNVSAGVLVVAYQTLISTERIEDPRPTQPTFDTFTDGVWIHGNTFATNGTDPKDIAREIAILGGMPIDTLHLEDVVWDGAFRDDPPPPANDFCFEGEGTFRNLRALINLTEQSTDREPYRCMRTARPPVEL